MDYNYYRFLGDLVTFENIRCSQNELCEIQGDDLIFGDFRDMSSFFFIIVICFLACWCFFVGVNFFVYLFFFE